MTILERYQLQVARNHSAFQSIAALLVLRGLRLRAVALGPLGAMVADDGDGFVGVGDANRNIDVFGVDQRCLEREHRILHPLDQRRPEFADQDQRRVVEMAHLQQLPDHHRLQHRTDPAGRDDKRIRRQHEVMQTRKERPVLERKLDKRIHFLLER